MKKLILGNWGLAGKSFVGTRPTGYGEVSPKSSSEVFSAAYNAGIKFIDTAPNYGSNNGYDRIRNWQNETGNKFNLIVKIGRLVKDGSVESYSDLDEILMLSEPILSEFDTVSHLFIKDPPLKFIQNGLLFEHLSSLKKDYPNLTIGFSTHFYQALTHLPQIANGEFVVELEYNPINSIMMDEIIRELNLNEWEIWGMQPLAYGFLTGKYNSQSQFNPDDWRSNLTRDTIQKYCLLAESFHSKFLTDRQISHAVRSALFCILNPSLDRIIIGPKSVTQFNDFLLANQLAQLPEIQYYYIDFVKNCFG